jgi:pimeloyl-ACP methyl ester carboxylesterase
MVTMDGWETGSIESADGTRIAYWRSGSGPPLLLVHGAMADHTRWVEVAPAFEREYTVYAMDRRGRAGSGDSAQYSMEREYEDVVAVIDAIGQPTRVVGHSYGAGCALGAVLLTDRIERLVLYEAGVLEGTTGYYDSGHVAKALDEVGSRLERGDREGAMLVFLREVIEYPEPDIAQMKASPIWESRVAAAHTLLRECRGEAGFVFDPERYRGLATPVLLVMGGESYQMARDGTAALDAALPNSRVVVLDGQGHGAISTAPDVFAREVLAFLREG